ncbi:UDP-glycosyltransferase UGT5-like [Schistocerca nitens]|uniref:UDP-glycosyltransferase UGT5-like n=1 Tax=Schistocerca nitens TaxID=7011 RepID=UPI00211908F0|nr:UDP-glycosyltransferase UGT5-like [Schistocerca nitens]
MCGIRAVTLLLTSVGAVALVAAAPGTSPQTCRVLLIFQMGAHSHWTLGRALAAGLAARGHHVTAVTPFSEQGSSANWTHVPVPSTMHLFGDTNMFSLGERGAFGLIMTLFRFGVSSCEIFLQTESVRRLFLAEHKFDVMIIEEFFSECFLPLAHSLRIPVIGVATISPTSWMADIVGSSSPYAYVPDTFLWYTDRMSFLQRLHNAAFATLSKVAREMYYKPRLEAVLRQYLNSTALPSVSDMENNTSVLLSNTHVSMFFPRPLSPNLIDIGGVHIRPPQKLPQYFQKLLDDAKDGVILFSLGSNLRSSDMPEAKTKAFFETFSKMKQIILWKWETDDLEGKPDNVKTEKWLPQSDIMAHDNVRLFITHGGLLSMTEAVHHGLPVVVVPFFGDQHFNARQAEHLGYAVRLDFSNITADSLTWALTEVLNNPSYRTRAREVSRIFHDRPRAPLEEAVWWTEYVVRHRGATALRSTGQDLCWYQIMLLDVVAAALAAFCLPSLAIWAGFKALSAKHVVSDVKKNE